MPNLHTTAQEFLTHIKAKTTIFEIDNILSDDYYLHDNNVQPCLFSAPCRGEGVIPLPHWHTGGGDLHI
jgi:hypothetical protein